MAERETGVRWHLPEDAPTRAESLYIYSYTLCKNINEGYNVPHPHPIIFTSLPYQHNSLQGRGDRTYLRRRGPPIPGMAWSAHRHCAAADTRSRRFGPTLPTRRIQAPPTAQCSLGTCTQPRCCRPPHTPGQDWGRSPPRRDLHVRRNHDASDCRPL